MQRRCLYWLLPTLWHQVWLSGPHWWAGLPASMQVDNHGGKMLLQIVQKTNFLCKKESHIPVLVDMFCSSARRSSPATTALVAVHPSDAMESLTVRWTRNQKYVLFNSPTLMFHVYINFFCKQISYVLALKLPITGLDRWDWMSFS